jgi:hypothetical protein
VPGIVGPDGVWIITAWVSPHGPDEAAANACVSSAAPDMLTALKDIFELLDSGALVRNTADDGEPNFGMRQLPLVQRLLKARLAVAKAEGVAP